MSLSLRALSRHHHRHLQSLRRSPHTLRFYEDAVQNLETFLLSQPRVIEDINLLDKSILFQFQEALRARGLRPGSEHALLRGLRAMFNWAAQEELIDRNPMERVKMPSLPKTLQPTVTPKVAQRVLAALREANRGNVLRDTAIVTLMYDTGIRLSELTGLQTGDIDLATASVRVLAGKGGRGRTLPLGVRTMRSLTSYERRERKPAHEGVAHFFLSRDGQPLTKFGVEQVMDRLSTLTGLERKEVAPHAWRRGFAVQFLRNGGDLFALQQIMGHTSLEMTRRYVHYLPEDLRVVHTRFSPMDRL